MATRADGLTDNGTVFRWPTVALIAAGAVLTCSCFDGIRSTKKITDGYDLAQFEGSYIVDRRQLFEIQTEIGPLNCAVGALGWDDAHLVLSQSGGWVVIDLATDQIDGPLTNEEFARKKLATPSLAAVKVRSAQEVWNLL